MGLESHRLCFLIFNQLHKISISQMKHHFSTVGKDDRPVSLKKAATEELSKVLLDQPTNCCMSGCSNCVWIAYAENLAKLSIDGGSQAVKIIEQNVTDPCLKAFLLTELRMRHK